MPNLPIRRLVTIAAAATALVPASARADDTVPVLHGAIASGGSWVLSAEHRGGEPLPMMCLHVSATLPDGTAPEAVGCAGGVLHGLHNIMALTGTSKSGATTTSSLLGGLTVARARSVRLTFADGHHARLATHAAPQGFGVALSTRVRYFAADLAGLSRSSLRSIVAYDARHHRVGATHQIARQPLG